MATILAHVSCMYLPHGCTFVSHNPMNTQHKKELHPMRKGIVWCSCNKLTLWVVDCVPEKLAFCFETAKVWPTACMAFAETASNDSWLLHREGTASVVSSLQSLVNLWHANGRSNTNKVWMKPGDEKVRVMLLSCQYCHALSSLTGLMTPQLN